jgi:hypothetical protein
MKFSYLLVIALLISSCRSPNSQTYEEQKMSIQEIEKTNPLNFLTADGTYNQNFWGDILKIHGMVHNKATVANYKDVVVEIIYLSQTDTELKRENYVIYDFFNANSSKAFELKVNRPSPCKKLNWSVVGATAL